MNLNPYLNFNGNCKAAFDYYVKHLGGKMVMCMTYADAPPGAMQGDCESVAKERIMHARLDLDGNILMGSDGSSDRYQKPAGFFVSINVKEPKEAERIYAALSEKGEIFMPIGETFWATRFAMFSDQFGTPWMINCEKEPS